jgi:hypothetical protein
MNREALSRRRFLKLVGATALTAPFVRSLPSYAGPGSSSDPVYLVLLFTSCGCVRYNWGAQGPSPAEPSTVVTPGPLVFRPTLSQLTKTATDLTPWVTVLDGLHNGAANGSHEAGMASLWTGQSNTGQSGQITMPSIDQAIAPLLSSQLNITRPYPSLSLYAQSSQDYQERSNDTRMLYDATGNFVDPMADPATALSTLFPSSTGSSMKTNNTPAIRAAVLSQVNSDLTAMQGRLCTDDRQQLQTLQELLNQANTQITNAAAASASCMAPTLGMPPGTGDPFTYNITAMSSLLAMALACDLTRVSSLQLSHALSPVTHTWLGTSQQQTHHIYSHAGANSLWSLGSDLYATNSNVGGNPSFASMYPQQLSDIDAFYAQQVANFAYMLSQLKTTTGKNLLDQTVICWGSELDMGASHNHDDTPFVLIGKGGGALKGNELVTFPLNLGNNAANNPSTNNRYHNDLLMTLAQIMGVELPGGTFGSVTGPVYNNATTTFCTTPIMEILA